MRAVVGMESPSTSREPQGSAGERPGRVCPANYRYSPKVFDRAADIEAETLYVVGGLYGNVEALERILAMAEDEPHPVTLAFNGDFHWFGRTIAKGNPQRERQDHRKTVGPE